MTSGKLYRGVAFGVLSLFCFISEALVTAGLIEIVLPEMNLEASATRGSVTLLSVAFVAVFGILAVVFGYASYKTLTSSSKFY